MMPYYPEHKYPIPPIYLTKEVFGTGWYNSRDVIISSDLAVQLINLKAINLDNLTPCRKDYESFLKEHPAYIPIKK